MNLSKHFTLEELIFSHTAISHGINNTPNQDVIDNLFILANELLEPARLEMGMIIVRSGYRCLKLNSYIGGAKNSQHMKGMAVDIVAADGNNKKLFNFLKDNFEFDQLIWEFGTDENPGWIHISFNSEENRNMVLRAKKVQGATKYFNL